MHRECRRQAVTEKARDACPGSSSQNALTIYNEDGNALRRAISSGDATMKHRLFLILLPWMAFAGCGTRPQRAEFSRRRSPCSRVGPMLEPHPIRFGINRLTVLFSTRHAVPGDSYRVPIRVLNSPHLDRRRSDAFEDTESCGFQAFKLIFLTRSNLRHGFVEVQHAGGQQLPGARRLCKAPCRRPRAHRRGSAERREDGSATRLDLRLGRCVGASRYHRN